MIDKNLILVMFFAFIFGVNLGCFILALEGREQYGTTYYETNTLKRIVGMIGILGYMIGEKIRKD